MNRLRISNKRGLSLIEIFFAFAIIIVVSIVILNSFSEKHILTTDISEVERDSIESLKAVGKSLAFHGNDNQYEISLTGSVPVDNLDKPDSVYLLDVYDESVPDVINHGEKLRVISRYALGETTLMVNREPKDSRARVSLTSKAYYKGKFKSISTPSLKSIKESDVSGIGVYYTIPDKIYSTEQDGIIRSNILVPRNKNDFEVITYEKAY